ncbi:MAG: hypothetical protein FWB91_00095 [Defluviitaleaceae bacterium]|nr:hypothetical protein [Defluviitaleaceae bacterium]
MMEVIAAFPAIGTIEQYRKLPPGERILYDQYVLVKMEEEAKRFGCPLFSKK